MRGLLLPRDIQSLQTLNDFSLALLRAPLSVETICRLVYQTAHTLYTPPFFQIGLFDGQNYAIQYWIKDEKRLTNDTFIGGGDAGLIGWLSRTGQPLLVTDYRKQAGDLPAHPSFSSSDPPLSGMFIPLIAGDKTIGAMSLQSRKANAYSERDLTRMTAIANQTAWALRNAILHRETLEKAERLRLISQVNLILAQHEDQSVLFRKIATILESGISDAAVTLFVGENDVLKVSGTTGTVFPHGTTAFPGGLIDWVYRSGATAYVPDVLIDHRYKLIPGQPDTRSEIALPLRITQQVEGVLDIQSSQLDAFSFEDREMFEVIASSVSLALDHSRNYLLERRLRERMGALIAISQAVVSTLAIDDLLSLVIARVEEAFKYRNIGIYSKTGGTLLFRAGTGGQKEKHGGKGQDYSSGDQGVIPFVAREGKPFRSGDVTRLSEAAFIPLRRDDVRSELAVPLIFRDEVIGVIDIQSEELNAFSEEDEILMGGLADSIAVGIRNARLYEAERQQKDLADTLREVTQGILSELETDAVLTGILNGLSKVVTLNNAIIVLFDHDSASLTIGAAIGSEKMAGLSGYSLPLELLNSTSDRIEEGIIHLFCELLGRLVEDRRGLFHAPLHLGTTLLGYLLIDHADPEHFKEQDRSIVTMFTGQAAVAINNARMYAMQQDEAYITSILLEIAETVNSRRDEEGALWAIAEATATLSEVNRLLILSYDSKDQTFVARAHAGLVRHRFARLADRGLRLEEALNERVTHGADPIQLTGSSDSFPYDLARLVGTGPLVLFPLHAKSGLAGLFIVDDPELERDSEHRFIRIMRGIASQTAGLLESERLLATAHEKDVMQQELQVAHNIQASLIPSETPELAGWEIGAGWWAARQVSGDFYDFIPLRGGDWGLVIADVADKGVPAALFMAMVRTMVRTIATSGETPARTLEKVNRQIMNDAASDLFVTVFYGVLTPSTGHLRYACAGHNPPILLPAGEAPAIYLKARGIALGIIPEISLETRSLSIAPGDGLVAYTDGVTEAMKADTTEWGLERFTQILETHRGEHADALMDLVLKEIEEFVDGAPQSDDLTLFIIRRLI